MRSSCERGEADCSTCSRGGAAPADCSSCSTSNMETWDQTHTYSNYQPICYHNPHMGQQHKQTNNLVNQQAEDGRLGCAEVSSTSEREGCLASQKDGQNQREMGGAAMAGGKEGHQENFGSIITMLSEITANQCDLDEFLTDQGALHTDYRTHPQHVDPQQRTMVDTHVSNMQTEVKQEHPELDYTYMGPTQDYYSAYHPRTNIPHIPHQDGSGSVDNMYRPRSISSVSSGSEGADGSLGSEGPEGDRGYDRGAHYSRMEALPPQGVVLGIKSENKTKDEKYWERRRKNNLAAKKSRDARRVRENQLRLRVLCLENANRVLRSQVDREHEENVYLREKLQKIEQEKQTNPVPS